MAGNKILIYTDGSALGNPGPGGYGIVMKTSDGQLEKTFSKGFRLTTNNRMELLAIIDALKKIKDKTIPIEVYTDSKYVVDAVNKKWLNKWRSKGFAKTKNPDLWKDFLNTIKGLDISFHWVKGHNNHPENEQCDQLAVKAAKDAPVNIDKAYEASVNGPNKLF
ncbi:MAG TPA: ribonuclease HI [Flavobacteriia bacterium]|jgi:ribonuclease HI|nr:ribonuclease HI [Flavobacteriia bacterium]